ncbi:MAG: M16 family metallopeptidase [Muribaculaceae bacterium]
MRKFSFIFSLLMAFIMALPALAQDPEAMMMQPLPIDQNVRYGVLPNGLTYYIRHNEEPKNRAEFHIAQKVGSILEEDNQQGLAHFLEHMAFNGLQHYPGKAMLEYFQSIGLTFGGDINAYTGFDRTVYRLSNVPTEREAVLDSALLVLHDWSCAITLDEKEIDAERGVIHEEWRTRGDATQRLYESVLPIIFKGSKYANRLPIGTMDVVMNFKPQELRDYYHRWYRPDQQGIIVIGDFDAEKMEQKVKDLFSPIKMPKNPAKREYFPVPDHKGIDYALYTDPESSNSLIYLFFQHEVFPREQKNTLAYVLTKLVSDLSNTMFNSRLSEKVQDPESPMAYGYNYDGNFFIAQTKDAFTFIGVAKEGKTLDTYKTLLTEAQRVNLHGFTQSELDRAKAEIKQQYETMFNERDKRKNIKYAEEYIDHFTDGGYIPGIEMEYQLVQAILPQLDLATVNSFAKEAISDDNVSLIIYGPKKEGVVYPTKEEIESNFKTIFSSQVEAYEDNVSNEPLLANEPKAGKIVKESTDAATGITTMQLSNGATVLLKPTDFKNDEIQMSAMSYGGYSIYNGKCNPDIMFFEDVVSCSALGSYTTTALEKYLAGKKASINFSMNDAFENISGSSSVKDFETMLQMNYLLFTDVRKDEKTFEAQRSSLISSLKMMMNNPRFVFSDSINSTVYMHNPMKMNPRVEDVEAINYDNCLKLYRERVANAGDYTFCFVGKFDLATIRPMIEKYIASLPDNGVRDKYGYKVPKAKGEILNKFTLPMENPKVSVRYNLSGDIDFSMKTRAMFNFLSEVMDIVYTRTIREEEGGTYSVGTSAGCSYLDKSYTFIFQFDTNVEKSQQLIDRAIKELKNVVENGADAADFQKVKEAALKQYQDRLRENNYWMSVLTNKSLGLDSHTEMANILNNVTLADFNAFVKKNVKFQNAATIMMVGEAKK